MSSPLSVSVALCTHNGERFIVEQLKSILEQTLLPTSLVVSDDASSDNTMALIDSTLDGWRSAHPDAQLRVTKLANHAPLGVTRNFEQAVVSASGDLIALSDQDDVWPPNRLSKMVAEFEKRPDLLLLHSDAFLIDESGESIGALLFDALEISASTRRAVHSGAEFAELMKRNIVTGATTMVRRSLIDQVTPFPDAWLHDEWLAITASAIGLTDLLDEALLGYRQHTTNQIGAARLSLFGKLRRMTEPGSNRNQRLLARAEQLAKRFEDLAVTENYRASTREKLAHERARYAIAPSRRRRIGPIVREYRTGRYGRFGRGIADAIRDLLQPL